VRSVARKVAGSATAKMLVEVDDLGGLLEAEIDGEIGSFAAIERDRFLDMVGDAGALLRRVEDDAHRERLLAENRLIAAGHRHEIIEIDDVALRGRDRQEPRP
jgi:hypothetical protein